jgi:uncharacterized glyoxalase superfamily protein PhnB
MFTTYLNFKGDCAEACRFYERCFGGTICSGRQASVSG